MKNNTDLTVALWIVFLLATGGITGVKATEKIGELEEVGCQTCHTDSTQNPELLTEQGLYYQYMETLEGYEQVLQQFQSCTHCHVEQAGAKDLTAEGYRFRWMMEDMAGLRAWLDTYHPRAAEEEAAQDRR